MAIKISNTTVIDDSRRLVNIRNNTNIISDSTTAVSGSYYIATANITLTLPSSPTAGDIVGFSNPTANVAHVINRNGSNIMGIAEDLIYDKANTAIVFAYVDASQGWVFI